MDHNSPAWDNQQEQEHGLASAFQEQTETAAGSRTAAPPPFSLLAAGEQEQEGPEEELVESEGEISADQFADGTDDDEDNPVDEDSPDSPIQRQTLATAGTIGTRTAAGPVSEAPTRDSTILNDVSTDDPGADNIVPPLMLLGTQLAIDLSNILDSSSVNLNLQILPGVTAKRLDVVIEEGAFVSGTLIIEAMYLSGIDIELTIDAEGNVSVDLYMEHEFFGFPTTIQAQATEEGISGIIEAEVPAGHSIVAGLKTTGGLLRFTFGHEEAKLRGELQTSTDDGSATGTAHVDVDIKTGEWAGTAQLVSTPRTLPIVPGVEVELPEGFQFTANFGNGQGLTYEGSAAVIPQVTLQSADGIEAGGTAEVDVTLSNSGLNFILKKVRLAVTGGISAPPMEEVLQGQTLSTDVDAGAVLTLWFEENSLTQIDLEATAGIDTPEKRIGRLTFAGQALFDPFRFLGMLHAITSASFTLAQGQNFTTSVMPGSQLFVSLDESGISNVDASLGLEVADQQSALAQLTVASSLPRGQGLSLAAKLELLRRIELSTVAENGFGVAILPATELGATLTEGELTAIHGALNLEVADQEGDLLAGSVDGHIAATETGLVLQDGSASAKLLRDLGMDVGAGEVRVLEGATVAVVIEGGKFVGISGQIQAVYDDGDREISISAAIDYDPENKIIRSLDADLATDASYSLFGGKLVVSELEGGITIRNNEVVSLGGHARLDAFVGDFTMAGEADVTWSKVGEESSFVGSGWLQFSWYEEEEESDRFLNGRIDATIDGENFSLLGNVEMGLMKGLTGQATVSMDQEMDPVISASLSYQTTLMEADELWAMEFGLGIQIPLIPVLVTLEAGILFGMSINTRPLMVFGTVGVENWRPKSSEFPDFFAELRASWGLDIEAKAMAYLELILGIDGLLHLTGGIRAGVGLSIPIELAPHISLRGGADGIWGEMGIDISIAPVLRLLIEAYLKWGVLGLWDGEKVWSLMDQELANLGDINWSGSFAFGDKQEPTGDAQNVQQQSVEPEGSPIAAPEGLNDQSSLGFGNHENEPNSDEGLTGLTDGLDTPSAEGSQGLVDQGGLGSEFAKVGEYAEGVAAVADLIKILADGFQSFIKGGPIGLLIWLLFKKPSKDEINAKKDRVEMFRQQLMDENLIEEGSTISNMLGILSGSYSIWIIFDKSKPYRDMVDQGKHEEAILEDRAKILEGMIKGWTGEKDESRILTVLDYTLRNEGAAGVREMTELVGGPKRVRDQYESFLGQDRDERRELDRIFTASYGSNWGDNPNVDHLPQYTAEEGAYVKRTGRTWDELATEAFGHASYSVYLLNFPYNAAQIAGETAYSDYQANNNNNNNNNGGGIIDPDDFEDGMFDPPSNNNNTYNGPPIPKFEAKIPTMGEVTAMHANGVWEQRFPVPGVIEHAHWFENYHMIALFAYGDAGYADGLKAANPMVKEVLEGVSITLPSVEELGPPWIEVSPISIGSTGFTVWVSPNSEREPEMWMGSPDRLVSEFANEAMQYEEGETAGAELLKAATFTEETTQIDADNAVTVAENLIDFILNSEFGGAVMAAAWEEANPGDTIQIKPEQLPLAAEAIYGHKERAAWITVYNENNSPSSGQSASHSTSQSSVRSIERGMELMEMSPVASSGTSTNGPQPMKLPTWSEMNGLDPLPAAKRGVAPKATVEVVDGDTWSKLAQKAYGDWDLALKLAEFDANEGKTMTPGTIVNIPQRSELTSYEVAASHTVAGLSLGGDGPTNTGTGTTTTDPIAASHTALDPKGGLSSGTDDPVITEVDTRVFTPGSKVTVKAGDTWSAIAIAAYDDFALFVKLSNHPLNVPFKTLPDGAEIYLPTLAELEDVPEFGLGLSPTGKPLLTEMVRIPTNEELHHVWVEDHAPEGQDPNGVWMMASTPFPLAPELQTIKNTDPTDPEIQAALDAAIAMTLGEETAAKIKENRAIITRLVEENYLASKFEDPTAISASVGEGGRNKEADVRLVQRLLTNGTFDPEWIDGKYGGKTKQAILDFQNQMGLPATGLIDLNSEDWAKLKTYIPIEGDYYRGQPIDQVGKMGASAERYNLVSGAGQELLDKPQIGTVQAQRIQYDEKVRVLCWETGNNPTWVYVIGEGGAEGWVNHDYVDNYPLPEPNATLHHVKSGWADIWQHYKDNTEYEPETGWDDRHMLVAVGMANVGREGIDIPQDAFNQYLQTENVLYSWFTNQSENNATYNSITIKTGHNIWLPSWGHIQNLRATGAIAEMPQWSSELIDYANDFVEYDQVMDFFGGASNIMAALKHNPGKFMDDTIASLQGGFELYGENAGEYIFGGVTNWLLGDPNLEMPQSLTDIEGYANLALNVFGVDWETELKEAIGDDQLVDVAMEGFDYLKTFMNEGPEAVLSEISGEIQGAAEGIKVSLVEQLKTYATNKIVKEVGKRLVAMFVPGAGILVALQSLWKLIKSLYEQAEELVAMLSVIGSAMADIAAGDTAAASEKVKNGLVNLTNVLVGALFDFLNLGSIRDKIQSFIGNVQNKVREVIQRVVDFVKDKINLDFDPTTLGISANSNQDGRPVNTLPTLMKGPSGGKVEAHQLTAQGLKMGKAKSSYPIPGWEHARDCNTAGPNEWRRAHKISHQIGGPGQIKAEDNLFITNQWANTRFQIDVEHPAMIELKRLQDLTPDKPGYEQDKDKILFYEVDYTMHQHAPSKNNFAKDVIFTWGHLKVTSTGSVISRHAKTPIPFRDLKAPPPVPGNVVYRINQQGRPVLTEITDTYQSDPQYKIKEHFWRNVVGCRDAGNTFNSVHSLKMALKAWPDKTISDSAIDDNCNKLNHYINNGSLQF